MSVWDRIRILVKARCSIHTAHDMPPSSSERFVPVPPLWHKSLSSAPIKVCISGDCVQPHRTRTSLPLTLGGGVCNQFIYLPYANLAVGPFHGGIVLSLPIESEKRVDIKITWM